MRTPLFSFAVLLVVAGGMAAQQGSREIPVYPGAELRIEKDEEDPACCGFFTRDPAAKVLVFYEKQLGTKPLTLQEYMTKYPAMRAQMEGLQKALPPQVQYRALVLQEVEFEGRKGAEILEVLSSPEGTSFSLTEEQLGRAGARWGYEFRTKTEKMTDPDREYAGWFERHPLTKQEDYNLPVYPGSRVDAEGGGQKIPTCYDAFLVSLDPFEKVVAFYQQKLLGQLKASVDNGKPEEPFRFGDPQWDRYQYEAEHEADPRLVGKVIVEGQRGAVKRFVTVYRPEGDAERSKVPTYPYFDAERREVVQGEPLQGVGIGLQSEVLDEACVEIPRNAVWRNRPPANNEYIKESTYTVRLQ